MPRRKQKSLLKQHAKSKLKREQKKLARDNSIFAVSKISPAELRASRRSKVTTQDTPVITKPVVNPDVVTSIDPQTLEDAHVYVHCHFNNNEGSEMMVRVWSTTFLVDHPSGSMSSLIHAENVTMAPQWTLVPAKTLFSFLLIFSSLPKSCTRFDFREDIPQPGGFLVTDIPRNETDVYHIDLL